MTYAFFFFFQDKIFLRNNLSLKSYIASFLLEKKLAESVRLQVCDIPPFKLEENSEAGGVGGKVVKTAADFLMAHFLCQVIVHVS